MEKKEGQKSRGTIPLKVHMYEISQFLFTFFWHHSTIEKAKVQNFKTLVKVGVKSLYIIRFLQTLRYHQKRTVSLHVFGKNAMFHFAYSPKMHNSASSLNTLYTAENAQFYSAFSPTTISLTPRFR
jgi:hypothetical protein